MGKAHAFLVTDHSCSLHHLVPGALLAAALEISKQHWVAQEVHSLEQGTHIKLIPASSRTTCRGSRASCTFIW